MGCSPCPSIPAKEHGLVGPPRLPEPVRRHRIPDAPQRALQAVTRVPRLHEPRHVESRGVSARGSILRRHTARLGGRGNAGVQLFAVVDDDGRRANDPLVGGRPPSPFWSPPTKWVRFANSPAGWRSRAMARRKPCGPRHSVFRGVPAVHPCSLLFLIRQFGRKVHAEVPQAGLGGVWSSTATCTGAMRLRYPQAFA